MAEYSGTLLMTESESLFSGDFLHSLNDRLHEIHRFTDGEEYVPWTPRWLINYNGTQHPLGDGDDGVDCLLVHLRDDNQGGTWLDKDCSELHKYICERDNINPPTPSHVALFK